MGMFSFSVFEHKTEQYGFKIVEPISKDFRVFINGQEAPVYTCRISKHPFNRFFPGYQRSIDQTELASFVNLVSTERVKVEVVVNKEYEKLLLRPSAFNVPYTKKGDRVCFELEPQRQIILGTDDYHQCLFLFNSLPIEAPKREEVTYYFGPGIHVAGKITLNDNESVYVDKDALVFGSIFAQNAKNITVTGNGMFDDSSEARFTRCGYESYVNGNIKFFDCKNITIKGVLFRDSAIWCVNLFHCENATVDNVKVFGQWRYNTDGIDIVNSKGVTVKDSFVHSFDDAIVIKGIDRYFNTSNENITVDNCTLWCDWGKTCELGIETSCREYKNITFKNCNILRAGNTALDIQNGDFAEIHHITFENISVEFNAFDQFPVYQMTDEMVYDGGDRVMIPHLIQIKNHRYREGLWKGQYSLPDEFDLTGIKTASVHDVTFKNIRVYYDEGLPTTEGNPTVLIEQKSTVDGAEFYNVTVEDVFVNGKKIR